MARLADQIVGVCVYLSNFHPALVPPPVVAQLQEPNAKEGVTGGDQEVKVKRMKKNLQILIQIVMLWASVKCMILILTSSCNLLSINLPYQ